MATKNDSMTYHLSWGTVQPIVFREGTRTVPMFLCHFGRAEYDGSKPVLSDSIREQAQPIVDKLNSGEITEDDARQMLGRIWF